MHVYRGNKGILVVDGLQLLGYQSKVRGWRVHGDTNPHTQTRSSHKNETLKPTHTHKPNHPNT